MTADFRELRVNMVDTQIRTTDVTDLAVLDAFLAVPREEFVPAQHRELAYIDEDQLLADTAEGARYLMEPSPAARLVQLASVKKQDVVLDVGCGTGYLAAVLSQMASSVIALESNPDFVAAATEKLQALGCDNVVVVSGELTAGYAKEAPFDVILIEGAVDFVPEALQAQLKDGGRLVAIEGQGNMGVAHIYVKDDGIISRRGVFNAAVKLLPGFRRTAEFVF